MHVNSLYDSQETPNIVIILVKTYVHHQNVTTCKTFFQWAANTTLGYMFLKCQWTLAQMAPLPLVKAMVEGEVVFQDPQGECVITSKKKEWICFQ